MVTRGINLYFAQGVEARGSLLVGWYEPTTFVRFVPGIGKNRLRGYGLSVAADPVQGGTLEIEDTDLLGATWGSWGSS